MMKFRPGDVRIVHPMYVGMRAVDGLASGVVVALVAELRLRSLLLVFLLDGRLVVGRRAVLRRERSACNYGETNKLFVVNLL